MFKRKPLVILSGEIKSPPFSREARMEAGVLLGKLQCGGGIGLPAARPMPCVGARCLELRVKDQTAEWRIVCRADRDAVLVVCVFSKKTRATPESVIAVCKKRLHEYDRAAGDERNG
jgi:phage-related protein